jgi:hypothetical protein
VRRGGSRKGDARIIRTTRRRRRSVGHPSAGIGPPSLRVARARAGEIFGNLWKLLETSGNSRKPPGNPLETPGSPWLHGISWYFNSLREAGSFFDPEAPALPGLSKAPAGAAMEQRRIASRTSQSRPPRASPRRGLPAVGGGSAWELRAAGVSGGFRGFWRSGESPGFAWLGRAIDRLGDCGRGNRRSQAFFCKRETEPAADRGGARHRRTPNRQACVPTAPRAARSTAVGGRAAPRDAARTSPRPPVPGRFHRDLLVSVAAPGRIARQEVTMAATPRRLAIAAK